MERAIVEPRNGRNQVLRRRSSGVQQPELFVLSDGMRILVTRAEIEPDVALVRARRAEEARAELVRAFSKIAALVAIVTVNDRGELEAEVLGDVREHGPRDGLRLTVAREECTHHASLLRA